MDEEDKPRRRVRTEIVPYQGDGTGGSTRKRALRIFKQYVPDPAAALGALAVLGAVGVGGMMAWPYLVALAMLPLQILGVVLGSAALWQVYRLYRAWWMVSTARKLVGGRDD